MELKKIINKIENEGKLYRMQFSAGEFFSFFYFPGKLISGTVVPSRREKIDDPRNVSGLVDVADSRGNSSLTNQKTQPRESTKVN